VLRVDSNFYGSPIAHSRASSCQLLHSISNMIVHHSNKPHGFLMWARAGETQECTAVLLLTISNRSSVLKPLRFIIRSVMKWHCHLHSFQESLSRHEEQWRGCYCGGFADKRHLISAKGGRSATKIDLWNKSLSV